MSPPLPPADFASRHLEILSISAGTKLHRFYTSAFQPIYFDTSDLGRFNAPDGTFGVMYITKKVQGAFAETFLRSPGNTLIDGGFLRRKAYVLLLAKRTLRLIKMIGRGLAAVGATAEVPHGGLPYDGPQEWSRAIYDHPEAVDGIAYHARHDDTQMCYAIFDRASDAIDETVREVDLDADWFWRIALEYRLGLAP